jgi:putative ABC transport system permease protein
MFGVALLASYLVTLYPAWRASYSPLNQQLKA